MSYDGVVLIPLCLMGAMAGLVSLVARPRLAFVLATLALAAGVLTIVGGLETTAIALHNADLSSRHGWDAVVARGFLSWNVHDRAAPYLGWSALPLLPGIAGVLRGAWGLRPRRRRWLFLAGVLVCCSLVPTAVLVARWGQPSWARLWPIEDVRWDWGYAEECLRPSACSVFERELACARLKGITHEPRRLAELRSTEPEARVSAAVVMCGAAVEP